MPFPTLHPALRRALDEQGYAEPTPVQAAVLAVADDRDLLVSAQTGSGKTVAFGLALAKTLMGEADRFGDAGAPVALIIAPTRELALQVQRELSWLYAHAGANVQACVGGMDPRREARALAAGCHVVVATPGRLKDHLERGNFDASALEAVVLDEADEMLDLGFREDLEFILDSAPAERRTLMFSATIPREISALARKFQTNAERIDTIDRREPHEDIEYRAIRVAPNDIDHALVNLLRWYEAPGALVFCATREAVRRLHGHLVERGFAAVALSGELSQNERTHALQALRDGRARVCVATDVAARGLDLPDLGLVIHADLPTNKETLTHRSGRTGRAGKKGVSVVLVSYTRRRRAELLLASANIAADWAGPPTAEEIRARDQERLLADPVFAEEPVEGDAALAAKLLAERTPEEIAAALIRLHRARLPSPEDLLDDRPFNDVRQESDSAKKPLWRRREPRDAEFGGSGGGDNNGGMVWFRLTVGRRNNADPKWLIPLICRLGHVTKKEIGSIRIFNAETRFEIEAGAAERFAAQVKDAAEKDARIEPSVAPEAGERDAPRPKHIPAARRGPPPRGDRGEAAAPRSYGDKAPRQDKPAWERKDAAPSPARDYGDKPAWTPFPTGEELVRKPRADYGDRPARAPSDDKPAYAGKGPPRSFGDKPARAPGEKPRYAKDGPKPRSFGDKPGKPAGDKPAYKGGGDKPFKPKGGPPGKSSYGKPTWAGHAGKGAAAGDDRPKRKPKP
ncbi:MAG TPA: DEAD/DEAH box helicase [Caulobacteraceae bacterium]|nr:DEAD/DEAH box helicase [Caulobacteraceae bacterium]